MATVRSMEFAGKQVSVPHTEHGVGEGPVRFAADGTASVSAKVAKALVELFPRAIELVPTTK